MSQDKDVKGFASAVADLIQSPKYQELESKRANFWHVLEYGQHSIEVRYSRMLRWLLDPNETHGLGNAFLEEFLRAAGSEDDGSAFNISTTTAKTEALKNIDVLVHDSATGRALVIENKMWSGEHNASGTSASQLKKYYEAVAANSDIDPSATTFVYLTPTGQDVDRSNSSVPWQEAWIPLSYEELERPLEHCALKARRSNDPDTSKIIEDFIDDQHGRLSNSAQRLSAKVLYQDWDAGATKNDVTERFRREAERCGQALGLVEESSTGSDADESFLQEVVEAARQRLQEASVDASDLRIRNAITFIWTSQPILLKRGNSEVQELFRQIFNTLTAPDDSIAANDRKRHEADTAPEYQRWFSRVIRKGQGGLGLDLIVDAEHMYWIRGNTRGDLPSYFKYRRPGGDVSRRRHISRKGARVRVEHWTAEDLLSEIIRVVEEDWKG